MVEQKVGVMPSRAATRDAQVLRTLVGDAGLDALAEKGVIPANSHG